MVRVKWWSKSPPHLVVIRMAGKPQVQQAKQREAGSADKDSRVSARAKWRHLAKINDCLAIYRQDSAYRAASFKILFMEGKQ